MGAHSWWRRVMSYDREMAEHYYRNAMEYRRFARVLRRWDMPGSSRKWMRDAIRQWKLFKHYSRRNAA